jgi:hypothetical protein
MEELLHRLRRLAWLVVLAAPLAALAIGAAQGEGLERVELAPLEKGEVVLEIATPAGAQQYDLATLEAIGVYRMTTSSQWDQESPIFEGVLLSDLLADAGLAEAQAVELTAADDYSQAIPREDWTAYPVLVATRQDGQLLQGDERGPLRMVYPLSLYPELDHDDYHARWVWSLKQIKAVEP